MKAHVRLGRVFGVEIGLHFSWLLIAILITFSLAAHFQEVNRGWSAAVVWGSAILTGILFFAALIAHELSHAMVARRRGLPIRRITLFALGGVAQIEKEAGDAKTEFWMGIAGPITSVVVGLLCLLLAYAIGWVPRTTPGSPSIALLWLPWGTPSSPPIAVLVWLGKINLMLAAFNMIPGFPLDGGRVLRAVVWGVTRDENRSTRIAARIGQGVAVFFIVLGIFRFFGGQGAGGLWLAFIGWFLLQASGASLLQMEAAAALRGVRARDIMSRDCAVVDAGTSLQEFVDQYLLRTGGRCFLVSQANRIAGLITPNEVRAVDRDLWAQTPVQQVMRPLDRVRSIAPDTPVYEALELMGREDINQLPIMVNGRLEGILSRGHILQVLQARAEMHM